METITFSDDAKCAAQRWCYPITGLKKGREAWIAKNDLFLDGNGRVFALVQTATQVFFMDAITGSLYQFGECISSPGLKAHGLRRNKAETMNILLSYRPTEIV